MFEDTKDSFYTPGRSGRRNSPTAPLVMISPSKQRDTPVGMIECLYHDRRFVVRGNV
jgi:hypothetical protein